MFVTIEERAKYCSQFLRRRYRKLLSMPSWTEEELVDLGPILSRSVRVALEEKRRIAMRIKHCLRRI